MKCDNCPVRDFIHADLYCRGCPDRHSPPLRTGRAYLFRKNEFKPVTSCEIEARAGLEYETAAVELMSQFRIEFEPDDLVDLAKDLLNEF